MSTYNIFPTSLPRLSKSEARLPQAETQTWDELSQPSVRNASTRRPEDIRSKRPPTSGDAMQSRRRRSALDIDIDGNDSRPTSSGSCSANVATRFLSNRSYVPDCGDNGKRPCSKSGARALDVTTKPLRLKPTAGRHGVASLPDLHSLVDEGDFARPYFRDSFAKCELLAESLILKNSKPAVKNGARKHDPWTKPLHVPAKLAPFSQGGSRPTTRTGSDGQGQLAKTTPSPLSHICHQPELAELSLRPRSKGGITPASASRKFQIQEDCTSRQVASLAHKYRLPLAEVQRIANAFNAMERCKFGQISLEEFRTFLCKAFDVPTVAEHVVENAMSACSLDEMTLDKFMVWYVQNMFQHVAGLTAAEDKCESEKLVRNLAKQSGISVCGVDRIKQEFDRVDTDGNGSLDREEFERMLHSIFHASAGELSESRINHFWMEIDSDGSGTIDFPEFCRWHGKYFNSNEFSSNLVSSFYASFNPNVQRRNCLRGVAAAD